MQSDAETVEEYLAELPEDRRAAIAAVRSTVLEHLPEGYVEEMGFGMITYVVPLERYPDTYNGKPLVYASLASQKRHMAVYLMCIYMDEVDAESFEDRYRATGKRLDKGKSCVRFRRLEDLPLELIGKVIGSVPVDQFIAGYESARSG
jgi:uncharacterized protein YdhG (YjbR/CyaY superfamily)